MLFLIKKKRLFFLLFIFFSVVLLSNLANAQKINLKVKDESLSRVLISITQQTGIRFSYNPQIIDTKKKVSVIIEDKNIDETLKIILPSSVNYRQVDKHIILSPKNDTKNIAKKENAENNSLATNEEKTSSKNNPSSDSGISGEDCLNSINFKKEEEMKEYLAALLIGTAVTTNNVAAQDTQTVEKKEINSGNEGVTRPFQATFVYPLGTDGTSSISNTYNFSLNIIGGVTGGVNGCELGYVFNISKGTVNGVQVGGVFNTAAGNGNSSQFSGVFNLADTGITQVTGVLNMAEKSKVQAAGIGNIGKENNVQVSGIFNTAKVSPYQFAGVANATDKGNIQLSGVANIASESTCQMTGIANVTDSGSVQLSGVTNIASGSNCQITGVANITNKGKVQLSGVANIASESDCQITGVFNMTKKGGFQLGVINVRDTADGISFGILNIVKRGGVMELGLEGSEFIHLSPTFRSGTRQLYSILSVGYNFSDDFWAFGMGLGTSFRLKDQLSVNLELIHYNLDEKLFSMDDYNGLVQLRPVINYEIAKHFKVYLGPTFNLCIRNTSSDNDFFDIKIPYNIFNKEKSDVKLNAWIGFTGGIKF